MTADWIIDDLARSAPCGLLAMSDDGIVLAANAVFIGRTGRPEADVIGQYFVRLLTRGSRLYYEAHFEPLLRMHGEVSETVLHLARPGQEPQPVLVTATIDRSGLVPIIRTAVFDAATRVEYERDLRDARRAAEESLHRVTILERVASALTSATTSRAVEAALGEAASSATGTAATAQIADTSTPHSDTSGLETSMLTTPIVRADGTTGVLIWTFERAIEVDEPLDALFTALGQQAALVLDRVRLLDRIEHQAMHDELTGLPNRVHLRARLSEAVSAAHRHGTALSVLFLDLDGFKAINDTLGHPAGDTTLQVVAERFLGVVRAEDVVGRLGGDEFVVLCEHTDGDAAMVVAERLCEVTAEQLPGELSDAKLSASIGIVTARPTVDDTEPFTADQLVRLADEAMYEAKRGGHGIRTRHA